ncbi:MAG: hypothetical protein U5K37_01365 [Natrialbaceae archaeon]|nr:hypothetical protein [Natrialbaceae archaeon]
MTTIVSGATINASTIAPTSTQPREAKLPIGGILVGHGLASL